MHDMVRYEDLCTGTDESWLADLQGEEFFKLDLPGPDIVAIRRSIIEFKELMAAGEGTIHSASAAVLLYQHLISAEFLVQFEANDKFAVVQAASAENAASLELADMVSDLLNDLSSFQTAIGGGGFTVRRISNTYAGSTMMLTVVFAGYDAPMDEAGVPRLPPLDLTKLTAAPKGGAADVEQEDVELF